MDLRERLVEIFTARTQCRATANDIVQDAFSIALAKGNNSSGYLYGIAHNRMQMLLRTRGRDVEIDGDLADHRPSAAELLHVEFTENELRSLIKALPPEDRELLVRIAVDEQSQKEIAEELGTAHATVRKRWQRLRSHLRKVLAPISILVLLLGMTGGAALVLVALAANPPAYLLAPPARPPRLEPEEAIPVEPEHRPEISRRQAQYLEYSHHHFLTEVPDAEALREAVMEDCIRRKWKKTDKIVKIGFMFDDESRVYVTVEGARVGNIERCIQDRVLRRFGLFPVVKPLELGKPWRHEKLTVSLTLDGEQPAPSSH